MLPGKTALISDYWLCNNIVPTLQKSLLNCFCSQCIWDWEFSLTCHTFKQAVIYTPAYFFLLFALISNHESLKLSGRDCISSPVSAETFSPFKFSVLYKSSRNGCRHFVLFISITSGCSGPTQITHI